MLQAILRSVQISPRFYKVKTRLPSGLAALMLAGLNYIKKYQLYREGPAF